MSDARFLNGLVVKAPHENAPDFVKCGLSLKKEELITALSLESGEWINLQVKVSKGGKYYAQIDDWKPNNQVQPAQQNQPAQNNIPDGFEDSDLPFMRPHDEYFG